MDETWEDIMGEKTAKDLFKLIVRKGTIKADEASELLVVKRSTIDSWARALADKKYAVIEGEGEDETFSPTKEVLMRLMSVTQKGAGSSLRDDSVTGIELAKAKKRAEEMEAQLRQKSQALSALQEELLLEKKEKAKLEEIAKETEGRKLSDLGAGMLEILLKREREERAKLEELLRKKQAELDELRGVTPAEPQSRQPAAKPAEPELEYTDKGWAPKADVTSMAKKDDEIIPAPAVEQPKPVKAATDEGFSADSALSELAETTPTEPAKPEDAGRREPDADTLLEYLKRKGSLSVKNAQKELGIDDTKLNEWISELAEYDAVTVTKKVFGGVEITLKKDAELALVKEKIEAKRVREEIKRMRGGT